MHSVPSMFQKVATSKQYPKHKDETPSQTDDAKDLKSTDSDDEKSDTKDKDDEKDTNRDEKADKNIEKVTNDKAPKITSKNKKSKDIEAEKLDANDQNKNNEKLKPGTSQDTETSDEEDTSKLTPTAGEDHDEDKKDDSKTSNFDSKTNSKNHNDKGNDDKDNNGDKNKDDSEKNENTTNENDLNETAQKQQTKSDRAKDAQKPQVTHDNNDEKDKVKEDTFAAQSIKNEDNQYKEIEDKTESKDPQPENKGDKSSKTILTEDTDNKDVSKPEHATTDVDKTIQQIQPTTDNNIINENTQKPAARTTSENPTNSDTDKTQSNSNESKDKQDPAIATAKENELNDNEPSTDKPANELNGNTDSSPSDAEKTNDVSSTIKDKSEKDKGKIPQRSNDLAKDNNTETNPGNLEQPDTKQEAGTLAKDIQNSQGKDTDPVNFDTKPKPDVGEESAILPNSKNMPQDSPSAQEMANKETNLKQDNPQEAATIPNNIPKGNQEEANPVNNGKEIAETLPENDNMSKLKQVNNGQEVAQGNNIANGESQGLQGKYIKENNPVHAETNPNENNGQVETGTTPVSNDIANVKQNVQEKVIEENSPVPGGDSIAAVKQNLQEKNINNSVQEQAPTTPEADYIANVKQNLPQNDFKENSAINAGQEQSATVPGSNFADVKQNLQQNDINNPSQEQGARLAENDNGNVKQNPQENVGKDNNPGEQADVNSRNNNGQGLRLPSSDNMANDNHNSEEEINRKQDDSKSNKNKDIQNKVEQLSMNIGDQIKEDEERLKAAEVKSDDYLADTTKATGSSQAADTVPNQESKGEVPGGPTSTEKADVVSTLVEASSSNENSGGTSFRKVKDRTSGYNTEENLGDVTENKATQGENQ